MLCIIVFQDWGDDDDAAPAKTKPNSVVESGSKGSKKKQLETVIDDETEEPNENTERDVKPKKPVNFLDQLNSQLGL